LDSPNVDDAVNDGVEGRKDKTGKEAGAHGFGIGALKEGVSAAIEQPAPKTHNWRQAHVSGSSGGGERKNVTYDYSVDHLKALIAL
jgi:hypothetical protein